MTPKMRATFQGLPRNVKIGAVGTYVVLAALWLVVVAVKEASFDSRATSFRTDVGFFRPLTDEDIELDRAAAEYDDQRIAVHVRNMVIMAGGGILVLAFLVFGVGAPYFARRGVSSAPREGFTGR